MARSNKNTSNKSNTKKIIPIPNEFSRLVNVNQVPNRRPVLCRIIAKEKERQGLAKRFDITEITYFGANITLTRKDPTSIVVDGVFEAHLKVAELVEAEVIKEEFETLLLDNSDGGDVSFDDNMDYDDEVGSDGSIDIGEIAAQYFSLEM